MIASTSISPFFFRNSDSNAKRSMLEGPLIGVPKYLSVALDALIQPVDDLPGPLPAEKREASNKALGNRTYSQYRNMVDILRRAASVASRLNGRKGALRRLARVA
jgi:hypothetical protein